MIQWIIGDTLECYDTITPVAGYYKDGKWLTLGDGRFGLDSYSLKKIFGLCAFPTDISENMLEEGKKKGLINDYSVENAESLSFQDNQYEVVFCKEAFHHFPRPILALYEMIRVAKECVVLIEPLDRGFDKIDKKAYILSAAKILFNFFLNRKYGPYLPVVYNIGAGYEGSGNYIYPVSNRELNKIVHGMNLGGLAYYTFNDVYEKGVEFETADKNNEMFKRIKSKIRRLDKSGIKGLTTTIIFKNKVNHKLKRDMLGFGYVFPEKKDNPVFACGD